MTISKKLGAQFNKAVKTYERGRKEYPQKLINEIIRQTGMNKNSFVLDIGCGNGRSTIPFAKTGCSLLGIDPGKNLIEIARKKSKNIPDIKYKATSFEKFKAEQNSFDTIICGTAFHWLDKKTAYKKASNLLKRNGSLAIFYGRLNVSKSELLKKITKLFEKHCPDHAATSNMITLTRDIKKGILGEKSFKKPKTIMLEKIARLSKRQYTELLKSYSFIISLDEKQTDLFFKDVESLLKKYKSPLEIPVEHIAFITVRK